MEERASLYVPKPEERLPEHARYAAAGLPRDAWTASRSTTIITPDNKALMDHVLQFIDERRVVTGNGAGISVIGVAKAGKSFWLSAILRSVIYQDRSMEIGEEYADCRRVDYQELCSLWKSEFSPGLLETLRDARLLFVDNLYGFMPQPAVLSAMETRRDKGLTTLLAFLGTSMADIVQVWRIYEIFSDVNKTFVLEEPITGKLKGR
jgi:hypothetical protein